MLELYEEPTIAEMEAALEAQGEADAEGEAGEAMDASESHDGSFDFEEMDPDASDAATQNPPAKRKHEPETATRPRMKKNKK